MGYSIVKRHQYIYPRRGPILTLTGVRLMERNVGGLDRTARLVVGALLAIAGIAVLLGYLEAGTAIGAGAVVVAAILLATGVTQTCPINSAAGIDTTE